MTHDEAVKVLNEHQYGWIKHPPTKVCEALDYAIACLSKTEENERQNDLSLKTDAQDHYGGTTDMVTQFDERIAHVKKLVEAAGNMLTAGDTWSLLDDMQSHIRKLEANPKWNRDV